MLFISQKPAPQRSRLFKAEKLSFWRNQSEISQARINHSLRSTQQSHTAVRLNTLSVSDKSCVSLAFGHNWAIVGLPIWPWLYLPRIHWSVFTHPLYLHPCERSTLSAHDRLSWWLEQTRQSKEPSGRYWMSGILWGINWHMAWWQLSTSLNTSVL